MSGKKKLDLTGQRFGRLTAVRYSHTTTSGKIHWLLTCDCGNQHTASTSDLRQHRTMSCGCYHRDKLTTHNKSRTPEYHAWSDMFTRCNNPNSNTYQRYGGRAITICDEWRSFDQFHRDMGDKPSPEYSLDRINNNGNYCKENCHWATKAEQYANRRGTREINQYHKRRAQILNKI